MDAVGVLGGIRFDQTLEQSGVSAGLSYFEEDDVIVAKITPCFENGKCALAENVRGGRGLGSTEFHVIRPGSAVFPRFLFYVVASAAFRELGEAQMYGAAGQKRVPADFINDFLLSLPDRAAQRAIAAFLDVQTSRIDALMTKKQRLIELLDEERQALISRAVTQGLDLGLPMKASGVELLGRIPAHWSVRRIGSLATVVRGASPRPAGDPQYFNGDCTPWITVGELTKDNRKYLDATETFLTAEGTKLSRLVQKGTLLLSNSGATLGIPKITRVSGCINDGSVAFLRLMTEIDQEFLYYVLSASTKDLRGRLKQGAGQPNFNTALVKAMNVPLPPFHEQRRIVDALDDDFERSTAMQGTILSTIDPLREYRSALITAAVTGQLDLREHERKVEALA